VKFKALNDPVRGIYCPGWHAQCKLFVALMMMVLCKWLRNVQLVRSEPLLEEEESREDPPVGAVLPSNMVEVRCRVPDE
jgi:hypothetical protein